MNSLIPTNPTARANILGIGVHAVSMQTAVDAITNSVLAHHKGYVCVASVHGVMEAQRDAELAQIYRNAFLVVPDGMPTVWMGRLQGLSIERVFGPDLMMAVLREPRLFGSKHFLYGGEDGVAECLQRVLSRKYPQAQFVGAYCPPFRPLSSNERDLLLDKISAVQPDIIWVGLSTPKQERFMADYLPLLRTTLMVGVGAAFDYHTGRIKDSPQWLKQMGLQWMHRLIQEPARLWRRYLWNNPQFIYNACLHVLGIKEFSLDCVADAALSGQTSKANRIQSHIA